MQTISPGEYAALVDAVRRGIAPRDFVWVEGLNKTTGEDEDIGFWNGPVPVTVEVINPATGNVISRRYEGVFGLMQVPSVPKGMKLEVRSIKTVFSNLSIEVLNAFKVYNAKNRPFQIHRGLLDPDTMNMVAPARCRFDGLVKRTPFLKARAGNDGRVTVECVSHAQTLAIGSPEKFSDEFMKRRGGRQLYLDVVANVPWGQEDMVKERKRPKNSKWIS